MTPVWCHGPFPLWRPWRHWYWPTPTCGSAAIKMNPKRNSTHLHETSTTLENYYRPGTGHRMGFGFLHAGMEPVHHRLGGALWHYFHQPAQTDRRAPGAVLHHQWGGWPGRPGQLGANGFAAELDDLRGDPGRRGGNAKGLFTAESTISRICPIWNESLRWPVSASSITCSRWPPG